MQDFAFCSCVQVPKRMKFEYEETFDPNQVFRQSELFDLAEWPHNWADGEISYRLNNHTQDFNERNQVRAVTVALRAWQLRITKLKFRRERNITAHVDLNVDFETQDKFSSVNVFAHAWFPNQGDISGDVEINDETWDWVSGIHMSNLARPPLVPVLIHEFGHSLGLRHDTAASSSGKEIMYPSLNMGRPTNKLGERTVARIQERYGERKLPNWIIRYFQKRRSQGWDFY